MTERYLKVPVELLKRLTAGDIEQQGYAIDELRTMVSDPPVVKHKAHCLLLDPEEPESNCSCGVDRRVRDRRVSPAVGDFALQERESLLARIEELQQKAVVFDLYTEEAQRLGFGGISEALDTVAAQAEKLEYQDAVIVQRNNEISRMFAEADELKAALSSTIQEG